ncbi:permease prefix domain 1-containing protein [Paenibacillus aurantiacus]|uniref:Permease prefix domain 1-containing protein n=1 Tax=Paenibacillus aurantiacus TaxID=1936118 RepID=A0ABV5KLA9_9BACL
MKTIEHHPLVAGYLDQVCAHVRSKEMHAEIRLELLTHLEELALSFAEEAEEPNTDAAVEQALRRMGNPELVGRQLHAAHKPKPE